MLGPHTGDGIKSCPQEYRLSSMTDQGGRAAIDGSQAPSTTL